MRKSLRSIAIPALISAAGLLLSARSAAAHGGAVFGLRAPHARFLIHAGHPVFRDGFVDVRPYAHRVFYRPRFGDGFWARRSYCSYHPIRHAHWVQVRRHRTGWIVVSPRHGAYGYGHRHPYGHRYRRHR